MSGTKRVTRGRIIEWCILACLLGGAIYLKLGLFTARVVSRSMEPTLLKDDLVLINRRAFGTGMPAPGDVVAFNTVDKVNPEVWVKRVVALPGDRVGILNGVLYRNGKAVKETYITPEPTLNSREQRVPKDCVWVLGDNRGNSLDSANWGPLSRSLILGKVFFILAPTNRFGHV